MWDIVFFEFALSYASKPYKKSLGTNSPYVVKETLNVIFPKLTFCQVHSCSTHDII